MKKNLVVGQATYKLIINNAVLDNILSYFELRKKQQPNNCQGAAVLEAHMYTAWLKATTACSKPWQETIFRYLIMKSIFISS